MSLEYLPLPNLPGYKPHPLTSGSKKQAFTFVNGQIFLKDEALPSLVDGGESSAGGGASSSTVMVKSKRGGSSSMENMNITLTFQAYFEEITSKGDERTELRVRKCNVYYFLENDTMAIVEKPQMNSGIPQGTLVRRGVVHKPDGTPFRAEDLRLGEDIVIYGRRYKLVDCDNATRKYMRRYMSVNESQALSVPKDEYEEFRKTIQPDLSNTAWGKYHSKKNVGKKYQEAAMGCNPDANNGREGFIRYGDKTVQFLCVWDNTMTMYGDRIEFSIVYHLCDDTVEIYSLPTNGGAKEQFSRLLKRSKLPKMFGGLRSLQSNDDEPQNYHWTDFYIGLELDVYARVLRIVDSDSSTRKFYAAHSIPLGPAEERPAPKVVMHEREIPPPTAFGSEEDSLRSCFGSLMPGPPPAKKYGENKNLCFFAALLSGGQDDVDRRFVVTYYCTDNTIKVQEPPIRNSGFVGGVFLSRRAIKMENGEMLRENDLYVGCKLRVLKHLFLLLEANEGTMRWMEDKMLPRASYYTILDKIRPVLLPDTEGEGNSRLAQIFASFEKGPEGVQGLATKDALRSVFAHYQLLGDAPYEVSEHEILTIMRGGGNKSTTISYLDFIDQLLRPTDKYK